MHSPIHRLAIDLLLSAMFQRSVYGITSSFMYGKPGTPGSLRRLGMTISYRYAELVRAALYVRQNGPSYLRHLAIDEIEEMLVNFISENYWYISNETFGVQFSDQFEAHVSEATRVTLAEAMATSDLFQPVSELTLFPLVPVNVQSNFDTKNFFLIRAEALDHTRLPVEVGAVQIVANQFPPLAGWEWKKQITAAWLGVWSPAYQASRKMKAVILGAIALTQPVQYRYRFSIREMFGGRCTFGTSATTSFTAAHTPPVMHKIEIGDRDHEWLSMVGDILRENDKTTRRQLRALEYFYRAWPLSPPERFPILCMALDALFGEVGHAAQAVIEKVRETVGDHVSDERLRRLMDVRASVIHGGAPDVYDSSKYARYYGRYETDPIRDMELVVAASLKAGIFKGRMQEHPPPDAELLAQLRAAGRMPAPSIDRTILANIL